MSDQGGVSGVEHAEHAEHFASLADQRQAARIGLWVFLSSETLLFAGLFGLYTAYRAAHPQAFHHGITHMEGGLGALNTFVLLTSSLSAALALSASALGRTRAAALLAWLTALFGLIFLAVKASEYAAHVRHGMYPGSLALASAAMPPALDVFWSLYFAMTGLHAAHVLVGVAVLIWLGYRMNRRRLLGEHGYPLELGVLYWHLVDGVWVFLWPLFYLTGAATR